MKTKRILAIDPIRRGFGFVILEFPERLIDWGVTRVQRNGSIIDRLLEVVRTATPNVLLLEDCSAVGCRRRQHVRVLLAEIERNALALAIRVRRISAARVALAHGPAMASSKHERAIAAGIRFPELAARVPPPRKLWKAEDERTSIFDAMGLAICYLNERARMRKRAPSPRSPIAGESVG